MDHYRDLFPVVKNWTYMNHAANAPEPKPVTEAITNYLEACSSQGTVMEADWQELPERVRSAFASLVNCDYRQVCFVPNVSAAANIVAGGLNWRSGDNIVTTKDQFPANVYPWLFLRAKGVEVRFADWQDRGFSESVTELIDDRTRVVAVSWVEFFCGHRHSLAQVGNLCRQKGIIYCVDVIQGLGMATFDSKAVNADVVVAGGQKWLLGPEGQGAMYIHENLMDKLSPPCFSWRSIEDFMNFDSYHLDLKDNAQRYEGGTPNNCGIVGLGAAMDLLLEAGMPKVEQRVSGLVTKLITGLNELNVKVVTPQEPERRAGIVTFMPRKKEADIIVSDLLKQKIVVSARKGCVRLSPHFYNTPAEVDYVLAALASSLTNN